MAIGAETAMATAKLTLLELIRAPAQLERPLATAPVRPNHGLFRKAPMRLWLLPLLLAACASPAPLESPVPRSAPEAAVCRGEDGQVLRQDPRIGAQTGMPTPRSIYTRRAATFRAGPKSDEAELFTLEKPLPVVILRECGFYRLARAPDGRTGWLRGSALTTHPPAQARRAAP
ncbi:hypothetical protein [Dankookia sp. GCM10030260]|uniref:hypothetical protein n=1 Tax=Dankookia sp. GCM10030260 TaxID=3273390 RepID=UPI0036D292A3